MATNRRIIALESYALAAICLLDLATTLFWVSYRNAAEGNPLMAFYLHHGGVPAFIAAKLVLCAMPLFVVEWARRMRPHFAHSLLRFGIVAYLTLYVLGVVHVNHVDTINAAENSAIQAAHAQPLAVTTAVR
jgi:hypothetical protein